MAPDPEETAVEVVYALPACQRVVTVPLGAGMTALEAVNASGLLAEFPELDGASLALGIYGRRVEGSQRLRPGDRVEIYRPLCIDPRAARRRQAAESGGRRGRRNAGRSS
jgi:putative ubiquitin-RnfH superfamily antitoxin RatB of RatAB toxin-antitoxin module